MYHGRPVRPVESPSDTDLDEYGRPVADIIGIGVTPANLSMAALAAMVPTLTVRVFDPRPRFDHADFSSPAAPPSAVDADLVNPIAADSPWSFHSYLEEHQLLPAPELGEEFTLPHGDYLDYCEWVAEGLPSCQFGVRVNSITPNAAGDLFEVRVARTVDAVYQDDPSELFADGVRATITARNIVLGTELLPLVPPGLRPALGPAVFHAMDYPRRRSELRGRGHITVVGSGQAGAEIFLDLLRRQPDGGWSLTWLSRAPLSALAERDPIFGPYLHPDYLESDYPAHLAGVNAHLLSDIAAELGTHHRHGRRPAVGIYPSARLDTINRATSAGPADRPLLLAGVHTARHRPFALRTGAVVLATGEVQRRPACVEPIAGVIGWDARGVAQVDDDHRVRTAASISAGVFVHDADTRPPAVSEIARRNALILNRVAGFPALNGLLTG